jgi:hypothetical protein
MGSDQGMVAAGEGPWGLVFAIMLVAGVGGAGAEVTHHRPSSPQPTASASADIPANYLIMYRRAAGTCSGLSWTVLAGIGEVESNHGRSRSPGVRSGENFAGAAGPMQFLSGTWAQYGRGGNRYDPADAIPAAARLLCANGIGQAGGRDPCPQLRGTAGQHRAIRAYNHACWYVRQVLGFASSYTRR